MRLHKIAELKHYQHLHIAGVADQFATQIITPARHLDRGNVAGNKHYDSESATGITELHS